MQGLGHGGVGVVFHVIFHYNVHYQYYSFYLSSSKRIYEQSHLKFCQKVTCFNFILVVPYSYTAAVLSYGFCIKHLVKLIWA